MSCSTLAVRLVPITVASGSFVSYLNAMPKEAAATRHARGHGDEGVVAILDPRLRSRAYGRRFLEALPPAPVVAELTAVDDFFGTQARATA